RTRAGARPRQAFAGTRRRKSACTWRPSPIIRPCRPGRGTTVAVDRPRQTALSRGRLAWAGDPGGEATTYARPRFLALLQRAADLPGGQLFHPFRTAVARLQAHSLCDK